MKKLLCVFIVLASMFAITPTIAADDSPVFELRIYTTHPGKMPNLLERFKNHTTKIFERHGMINVGYWQPVDEKDGNTLYYILKHKSRATAEASWKAFVADPEWIKVQTESESNGLIVAGVESIFLTSTDFSAIK
ncbi:NIPSNAP family protein [Cellvibrio sp. PSBB023]|uniref:NIPSNAP family protein n=1 Tax=Cellvibrio sp. PSBB023 TaxID=1945512 RepID=UPI0009900F60|nr:NIPSNAP family protein [Cellvibrio sp. PSBB023]AQT58791.1 NIPSNAP family protein [Cellvibrio sp. PSBB023]